MRRFPETIATKQDIENIRNDHPEFHEQLKAVLQRATDEPTTAKIVASYDIDPKNDEMVNIIETKITRPNPQWKRWGFKDRDELNSKIVSLDAKMKV